MAKDNKYPLTLTPFLKQALKDVADKSGESQAAFIRAAIREKLTQVGYKVKEGKRS